MRLVYLLYKIKTRMILPRVWLKSKMWYVLAVFLLENGVYAQNI